MDPSRGQIVLKIIILIVLLILSAFFSSAETAFVSVNPIRMRSLSEEGNRKKRAALVLKIISNKPKMLSAILIGNNLVNLYASALTTTIAYDLGLGSYISAATGILTFILLILGEIAPKTLATTHADGIAMAYCHLVWALMIVLTPIIFVINKIAKGVLFIFGYRGPKDEVSYSEDELRTIMEVSHEEGVIEEDEHELLNNVFEFGDCQAKDVMIPRVDMTCVAVDSTYEEILETFRKDKFTRLPIYDGTLDNVVGFINMKDLLLLSEKERKNLNLKEIMREPFYTYEFQDVSELLNELRKTANNFAIILDEYGSTVGMVTLEDILEELVGEIRDEYDEDEEDEITKISEDEYVLLGTAKLDDLKELFPLPERDPEDEDDYDSVSGLIIDELGRLPQQDDIVDLPGLQLVVEECDKNRINKVHVYVIHTEQENGEDKPESGEDSAEETATGEDAEQFDKNSQKSSEKPLQQA